MNPNLASVITIAAIIYLFRRDIRQKPNITKALWIPVIWLIIIESRSISEWLDLFGISLGGISLEEGSPLDALFFFVLIGSGIYVLIKRRVSLEKFVQNNIWLTAFLLYCLISFAWSDFPVVALKRWYKVLGHPIMVLLIFTEPDPEEALTRLMKRCAYIVVPISVLFIKYFPQWGRGFSEWTGEGYNTGITLGKNALGYDCLILGFFFVWHFLKVRKWEKSKERRNELWFTGIFIFWIWWLISMANSSTSLMSLVIGLVIMLFLGLKIVDKRYAGAYILCGAGVFLVGELGFGLSALFIEALGRDPTLTGRTDLWQDVLKVDINPILGAGFESFWLGPRKDHLWELHWWRPNQAHNGYIETYINLGAVGLFLLLAWIGKTFQKGCRQLQNNFDFGRFRVSFLIAVVVYNWTEASFKALHPVWFTFYIIAIDYPKKRVVFEDEDPEVVEEGEHTEEPELTYASDEV